MNRQFEKERTLIILKPDAIQRSLIGEIIGRFERVVEHPAKLCAVLQSPRATHQFDAPDGFHRQAEMAGWVAVNI